MAAGRDSWRMRPVLIDPRAKRLENKRPRVWPSLFVYLAVGGCIGFFIGFCISLVTP